MKNITLKEAQSIITDIYKVPDDRFYEIEDFLYYGKKFLLEYLKNYDENKYDIALENLIISLGWFFGLVERYHLNLEKITWKRYSYKCPYCVCMPCFCDKNEGEKAQKTGRPASRRPKNLHEWQEMVSKIYTNEHTNELNTMFIRKIDILHHAYRSFLRDKQNKQYVHIENRTADYFISFIRVFNSLNGDIEKEFMRLYKNGCHVCKKRPCICKYT